MDLGILGKLFFPHENQLNVWTDIYKTKIVASNVPDMESNYYFSI